MSSPTQLTHDTKACPSGIEAKVCADIASRQQKGIAKYGMTVAENRLSLREWLQHAYEETLDKAIYLKRAIAEIDNTIGHDHQVVDHSATCPAAQEA